MKVIHGRKRGLSKRYFPGKHIARMIADESYSSLTHEDAPTSPVSPATLAALRNGDYYGEIPIRNDGTIGTEIQLRHEREQYKNYPRLILDVSPELDIQLPEDAHEKYPVMTWHAETDDHGTHRYPIPPVDQITGNKKEVSWPVVVQLDFLNAITLDESGLTPTESVYVPVTDEGVIQRLIQPATHSSVPIDTSRCAIGNPDQCLPADTPHATNPEPPDWVKTIHQQFPDSDLTINSPTTFTINNTTFHCFNPSSTGQKLDLPEDELGIVQIDNEYRIFETDLYPVELRKDITPSYSIEDFTTGIPL